MSTATGLSVVSSVTADNLTTIRSQRDFYLHYCTTNIANYGSRLDLPPSVPMSVDIVCLQVIIMTIISTRILAINMSFQT